MKTTKCIALLLAIVMTLALFAGCSNSPANDPATDAPATDAPSTAPDNSDNTDNSSDGRILQLERRALSAQCQRIGGDMVL